ncbi:hypothetical protein N656DRAFT_778207 [Canariomyces notabilis]|uniref:Thioesterase domain-containing protein n=1 Tax=Canariomyces notabilis TaxID=2074819 RepID=A0AAN6TFI7_9PEZI|nr:hypothetical protein N656DRAFT_778207 [Canariomyces arenarius]
MPQEDLQQANDEATARQIAYFRAIPWCAARLSACSSPLSSPPSEPKTATKTIITQCTSRQLRPAGDNQDLLMSRTLNHADAIPAYIMFYAEPADDPAQLVSEVQSFAALGPMVNGWDGICHGGIVVTLLDEAMGQGVVEYAVYEACSDRDSDGC